MLFIIYNQTIANSMQKSSFLSVKQLNQLFTQYINGQKEYSQVIEDKLKQNTNLTEKVITQAIVKKVREFILQLQKNLWMAEKIKQLKMYDHDSEKLFQPIVRNLKSIVPKNSLIQFGQLYKNSMLNYIQIIWQVQYAFVLTQKKIEIYRSFIQFAERQDLFLKSRMGQKDPTQMNVPHQSIEKIFPSRDLQLILRSFRLCNKNVLKTFKHLKNLQITGDQYKNQRQFVYRFDNVLLIGVYIAYCFLCQIVEQQASRFNRFIKNKFYNVSFDSVQEVLLRISIRQDPTPTQLLSIYQIIKSKGFFKQQNKERRENTIKKYRQMSFKQNHRLNSELIRYDTDKGQPRKRFKNS